MTSGIVYVAAGASFIEEACHSAATMKKHHPELPVTVFADGPVNSPHVDTCIAIEAGLHPKMARIACLARSPYERTLHLDSDTHVCGTVSDLFEVLSGLEFAIMPAPRRLRDGDLQVLGEYMRQAPLSYPQLNTGVMLYRAGAATENLFARWRVLYERDLAAAEKAGWKDPKYEGIGDQAAFREAFYQAGIRWMSLPPEYNCIGMLPGYLHDAVKILHGRYRDPEKIARLLNARLGPRVHYVSPGGLHIGYDDGTRRTVWTKSLGSRLARKVEGLFRQEQRPPASWP